MNKEELVEFINNIKIGDVYKDLKIDGLSEKNTFRILQESAKEKNLQFVLEKIEPEGLAYDDYIYIYKVKAHNE